MQPFEKCVYYQLGHFLKGFTILQNKADQNAKEQALLLKSSSY